MRRKSIHLTYITHYFASVRFVPKEGIWYSTCTHPSNSEYERNVEIVVVVPNNESVRGKCFVNIENDLFRFALAFILISIGTNQY